MTTTATATRAVPLPAAPNRRGALAWVALQDAPTPTTTDILPGSASAAGYLWLTVQTAAAVDVWAKRFGIPRGTWSKTAYADGVKIFKAQAWDVAGWSVEVRAHIQPEQVEPIDDTTRDALVTVAGAR